MPLREALQTIITGYTAAKAEPFASHPLATFIRNDAADAVGGALGELGTGLVVDASASRAAINASTFTPLLAMILVSAMASLHTVCKSGLSVRS
jgi:hypothetical protein